MNRKALLVFAGIYIFLYVLNYLTPMSFGDDYVYSFVWQGKAMSTPLPLDAVRVSSWHDLFISQWSHYFTWSGRTVAHCIIQFFFWMGKSTFNFFNAFIGILLIAEMYWCINKGRITINFKAKEAFWVFFALWAFTPAFSQVFFWVGGACNYVWTTVFLLGFLIPYLQKYYSFQDRIKEKELFGIFMFFLGILAGWSNENTICWIIVTLLLFLFVHRKSKEKELWMYTGLAGLIVGYALLMLAPGNLNRYYLDHGNTSWFTSEIMINHFQMFFLIFLFHAFMWYFCLRSLCSLRNTKIGDGEVKKDILLAKTTCFLAFGMSAIMLFSPEFPPRSAFSSTVQLIIACGILLRVQEEYRITLVRDSAKKFLIYVGSLYLIFTSIVTLHSFYGTHLQIQKLLFSVKQAQAGISRNILIVKPFRKASDMEDLLSGLHIPNYELYNDESHWVNVAFTRYYGIEGVRMEGVQIVNGKNESEHMK